jgi:hypothetical protein
LARDLVQAGLDVNPMPFAFFDNMVQAQGRISERGGSTIQPSSSPTAV